MTQIYMEQKEIDFSSLSDQALLASIGAKDANPVEAKKAFELFYARHSSYLWRLCQIVCRHHGDSDELAKELLQETMVKVYLSAGTFDASKGASKTWLSKVAKNEFINILRRATGNFFLLDISVDEDEFVSEDQPDDEVENIEPTLIEKGLSSLSEKERYILVTYMMYFDQDSPNRHLPDKQLLELSHAVGATPESIRQIKSRALKKLKKFLTENL